MSRGPVRAAVAEQVERDHAVAARGERLRRAAGASPARAAARGAGSAAARRPWRCAPCARARRAAGDRGRAAAELRVGEPLPLELEVRHAATLLTARRCPAPERRPAPGGRGPRRPRRTHAGAAAVAFACKQTPRPRRRSMAKQPRILAGETAAITGAARGIGRATAAGVPAPGHEGRDRRRRPRRGARRPRRSSARAPSRCRWTSPTATRSPPSSTAPSSRSARSTCSSTTPGSCRSDASSTRTT